MSWPGCRVLVRKNKGLEFRGVPWSLDVRDKDDYIVASMDCATWEQAIAWAGLISDPASVFAAIWDEGLDAGRRTGFWADLFGPPTNPYRRIDQRDGVRA